jgi:hypothetical protein
VFDCVLDQFVDVARRGRPAHHSGRGPVRHLSTGLRLPAAPKKRFQKSFPGGSLSSK